MLLKYITPLLALFLIGCANYKPNFPISKQVLNSKSSIVIAQVEGDEPTLIRLGGQGLLELAISEMATNASINSLKTIDTSEVIEKHYAEPCQNSLIEKGFIVNVQKTKIKQEALKAFKSDSKTAADYDFKALNLEGNSEYALVLRPMVFGAIRDYYGFIPTNKPSGYAYIHVYCVRLKDNELVGLYQADAKEIVIGQWDNPPEFNEFKAASRKALVKVLDNAHDYFFRKKPEVVVAQSLAN